MIKNKKKGKRTNLYEKTLQCYDAAILFKPTCAGYIYTSPEVLEQYFEEFKLNVATTKIQMMLIY